MSQFVHIRWPKYWSFSFSISPSSEPPGLISFRMDWLDLLAVQGTLKGLLQHHTSKASILLHSAFFMVQLSHPYMTTGKTGGGSALAQTLGTGYLMTFLVTRVSQPADDSGTPCAPPQERTLDFLPPFQWYQACLCCAVAQPRLTLCDSMDGSMPALPARHHLPEFAQWEVIIHFTGALATGVEVFLVFCYKQWDIK